jgi:hypothetical protein
MKKEYLNNGNENIKRKWLTKMFKTFPAHDASYSAMLSDYQDADREEVIDDFFTHFNDFQINIYNGTRRFDGNSQGLYIFNLLTAYKKNGKKDEIIFIDPDRGFYQLDIINGHKKTTKEYITMEMIEELMNPYHGISENSLVVVYQSISQQKVLKQYNPSGRNHIENVEHGLNEYFKTPRKFEWYQSPNYTTNKFKFYFFSRKNLSDKIDEKEFYG